jgi:hypothetical protein
MICVAAAGAGEAESGEDGDELFLRDSHAKYPDWTMIFVNV